MTGPDDGAPERAPVTYDTAILAAYRAGYAYPTEALGHVPDGGPGDVYLVRTPEEYAAAFGAIARLSTDGAECGPHKLPGLLRAAFLAERAGLADGFGTFWSEGPRLVETPDGWTAGAAFVAADADVMRSGGALVVPYPLGARTDPDGRSGWGARILLLEGLPDGAEELGHAVTVPATEPERAARDGAAAMRTVTTPPRPKVGSRGPVSLRRLLDLGGRP